MWLSAATAVCSGSSLLLWGAGSESVWTTSRSSMCSGGPCPSRVCLFVPTVKLKGEAGRGLRGGGGGASRLKGGGREGTDKKQTHTHKKRVRGGGGLQGCFEGEGRGEGGTGVLRRGWRIQI